MPSRLTSAALVATLLTACGDPATDERPGDGQATAGGEEAAEAPLDWATLIPIETEGIVRIDLARLRRSPHHDALMPAFEGMSEELGDPGLREHFDSLIQRTEVVLLAMLPELPGREREMVVLARGDYRPDEIERLNAVSEAPEASVPVEVRGHEVWVDRDPAEPIALAQIRPGTLALTSSLERMDRLLARTRMEASGPRWPPAIRGLVEDATLGEATLAIAMSRRSLGDDGPAGLSMALAGRADLDGPLDVEVRLEFESPAMATAAAVIFEGLIERMARAPVGTGVALRQLVSLARIEARGTQVVGSLHADAATAEDLVPALVQLLSDGDGPADEAPARPPTPPV
ncbi:MAG TPA: hypothetical protein RMH99_08260, partial [Sandaracinaceae bacterium LLY-WYZ-13_1]|nr:hypothetical protein [Sandaracinaceae bacterium LLY-WYZ-13_1]